MKNVAPILDDSPPPLIDESGNEIGQERRRWLSANDRYLSHEEVEDGNPSAVYSLFMHTVENANDVDKSESSALDSENFDQSDASFRNPTVTSAFLKFKRSNRPEPLFIPPQPNSFAFHSRLRSPRISDSHEPRPLSTFMPYTPPPMLSPVRSGSGLFCQLQSTVSPSPKSAPKGIRIRRSKFLSIQYF